jgi:hypothetical protein
MENPKLTAAAANLAQALDLVQQAIGAIGTGDDAAVKKLVFDARSALRDAAEASNGFVRDIAANDANQKA